MKKHEIKWNYTQLAKTYNERADYSSKLIRKILKNIKCKKNTPVIDMGAGTGKLTKILEKKKINVTAVEPNNSMRKIGIKNKKKSIWIEGSAEQSNLSQKYNYIFFGSSFNVINHKKAIKEFGKILNDNAFIICVFNHRDLNNNIQNNIEKIIKKNIKSYNYGLRRKNLIPFIKKFKNFKNIKFYSEKFTTRQSKEQIIRAFRSHATIQRQSKKKFNQIINDIDNYLTSLKKKIIIVPYKTVCYVFNFQI